MSVIGATNSTQQDHEHGLDVHAAMRGIFNQAAVGIIQADEHGQIVLVNEKFCQMLGFSEKELLGQDVFGLCHPEEVNATQVLMDQLRSGELDHFTQEKRYHRKNGETIWVNSAVSAIRNPEGKVRQFVALVQDVSDRRRAEQEMQRSTEKLRQLYGLSDAVTRAEDIPHIYQLAIDGLRDTLDADRAAVLIYDDAGVMRFEAWYGISDEYRALAEGHSPWPRDTVDPQPVLVPDIMQDASLGDLRERISAHGIHALGFIPLVFDGALLGKLMIYYDEPHAFTDEEVQLSRTIANHVAMAFARKKAEKRLTLYRQIVQNSVDGIAVIDPNGTYLEQNRAHAELLGYRSEDLIGSTPALHLGLAKFQEVLDGLQKHGIYRGEAVSVTKDGRRIDIELSAFGVVDEGKPVCYVGIKRDITERKRAESMIRESEERFRTMANSAPVLLWISDLEAKGVWFNKPWLDFRGRTIEEEIGNGWVEGIHPDDRERAWETCKTAFAAREPFEMEFRLLRADHEYRWILDHGVPRFSPDGAFLGYIGSCKDITDRKRAVQAIQQANQELEQHVQQRTSQLLQANRELEGFTYSVSHDLRAPLRAIMATSRILLDECGIQLDSEHRDLLRRQADSAKKLGVLIDELLKLSRLSRQEIVRTDVDVTQVAKEVCEELEARSVGHVTFQIDDGLRARADQKLLRFVIHNLFENAAKFSPEGGVVHLGREGDVFFVRDQGIGFDMQYAAKLFLPFERLVRDDEFPGTGIGLANVKRIVERHHGKVWADSTPGNGATFYFTISNGPAES